MGIVGFDVVLLFVECFYTLHVCGGDAWSLEWILSQDCVVKWELWMKGSLDRYVSHFVLKFFSSLQFWTWLPDCATETLYIEEF